jgi:hypothetical protein
MANLLVLGGSPTGSRSAESLLPACHGPARHGAIAFPLMPPGLDRCAAVGYRCLVDCDQ